ncbi:MAG TPA: hypothetical protein VEX64_10945, partial [Pyrinomonadaceae bacterium]|nr:hypothetical protein [Pyrinomonadaceae bacterium]
YADHHFLFHLLQIPFLWFFEPVTAAKVGAVVFATLAVFSCYWLILRFKIEYPLVWLLALLTCGTPFYYRMNMAKAPPLAIICTILGIWMLFEKRYVWLAPLMFVFVWAYSFFPILFVAAGIWTVIILWNEGRFEWKPLAFTTGGMIAGNIINPYFPRNLGLFFEHFSTKFVRPGETVPVGGEWYPYDSWMLLGACSIAFLAMLVGFVLFQPSERKLEEKSTFFLVFATLLMVAIFQSKRYAEYFPPFAILFAAFAWQAFALRLRSVPQLPEDFQLDIAPYLDKPVETEEDEKRDFWKTAFVGLLCVILLVVMFLNMRGISFPERRIEYGGVVGEITGNDPPERYQKAMEWALANIPEGERIFNTDWDDFPKIFFHDQKHNYVAGLDPKYLHSRNPELWKYFEEISTGKTQEAAPIIRDKFGAKWVFSDNYHDDFYVKAMESGWFEKVYPSEEHEARAEELRQAHQAAEEQENAKKSWIQKFFSREKTQVERDADALREGRSFDAIILKMRDQKGDPPAEAKDDSGTANDDPEPDANDADFEDTEEPEKTNAPNK